MGPNCWNFGARAGPVHRVGAASSWSHQDPLLVFQAPWWPAVRTPARLWTLTTHFHGASSALTTSSPTTGASGSPPPRRGTANAPVSAFTHLASTFLAAHKHLGHFTSVMKDVYDPNMKTLRELTHRQAGRAILGERCRREATHDLSVEMPVVGYSAYCFSGTWTF